MSRVVVTGSTGQVGWELRRALSTFGEVLAPGRSECNLADPAAAAAYLRRVKPDLVVNPAAYTAVDKAESEPELAHTVNALAPRALAEACADLNALLVHYSTDYVFDGSKDGVYREDDAPSPVSVYGSSKLAGEDAIRAVGGRHIILRTSWVYGLRGKNFLATMLKLAAERDRLRVVADQFGAPTWSRAIADATAQLLRSFPLTAAPPAALLNLTASGSTSWHGFASAIVEEGAKRALTRLVPVDGITTADYPTPASRPANSRLDNTRLAEAAGFVLADWRQSLNLCLDDIEAQKRS
ncbi:dTDP-4-dehydrorhamnose reductase [Nevskia sp.]|uniref:dTDP-4-dehydrorhamnose reductase n=1 Tax=Nevskia sp. TaxID=1929292 RepID=UPI0025F6DA8D|nr:dTDP-4-dehydrorhamnose reductase [Nevskia sp.]